MGLRQDQLNKILQSSANASVDAYNAAKQRDAQLRQLITGKEMDAAAEAEKSARDLEAARGLRADFGPEIDVASGSARIGGQMSALEKLLKQKELAKPSLTPGQQAAEIAAAKKIADYEAAGGRSTSQKNIEQVAQVESDLASGNRDAWDRKVGGALSNFPTLQGLLAPTEKARRDRAYNAANMLARQSDPNPTQAQIMQIMGQIYDPASDDATNLERLRRFQQQQRGVDAQMQQAAENLSATGFSMPGLGGNPPAPSAPPVQAVRRTPSFEEWKAMKRAQGK